MSADLATAHANVDRAIDCAYRREPIHRGEIERIKYLFDEYAAAIAGAQLTLEPTSTRRRRRTSRSPAAIQPGRGNPTNSFAIRQRLHPV